MGVSAFDHVAIPIENVDEMLSFYRALGFTVQESRPPYFYAICFGDQKINLHGPEVWKSQTFSLRGPAARPGCGDFCFVWDGTLETLQQMLERAVVAVEEGPVSRVGGRGGGSREGTSIYVRDPDANLLEFIVYPTAE